MNTRQNIDTPKGLFESSATEKSLDRRIEGLDELRGLSIIWVMICHASSLSTLIPNVFGGYGFHGVVLFFMISGFLITKILLNSDKHETPLRTFYIRRLFRIWPLFLVALLVSGVLWPEKLSALPYYFLFINNFVHAFGHENELMVRTDVMWSLAIEEQFYLLWPLFVLCISKRLLMPALFLVSAAGFLYDIGFLTTVGPPFKNTQGCMQYIAMGALLAFGRKGLYYGLALIPIIMIFSGIKNHSLNPLDNFRWVWHGVTFLLFGLLFITIYIRPIFKSKFLAVSGRLCFGLYLIHFFLSWAALVALGENAFLTFFLYFTASYMLAALSFKYFENPVSAWRIHFERSTKLQYGLFGVLLFTFMVSIVQLIP